MAIFSRIFSRKPDPHPQPSQMTAEEDELFFRWTGDPVFIDPARHAEGFVRSTMTRKQAACERIRTVAEHRAIQDALPPLPPRGASEARTPAKPAAKAPKRKERRDIVELRKAAAALDAEQWRINRQITHGHIRQSGALATLIGVAAMLPIMLLMRWLFL